jgi:hypothetical protein
MSNARLPGIRTNLRNLMEESRKKVDFTNEDEVTKRGPHPRPQSLPRDVTNPSDIPFQIISRVVVEGFRAP